MEKLIHRASGELVTEDVTRIVGTILQYYSPDKQLVTGVVTEQAVAKYFDDWVPRLGDDPVFASWNGQKYPTWMPRSAVIIVKVGNGKVNT